MTSYGVNILQLLTWLIILCIWARLPFECLFRFLRINDSLFLIKLITFSSAFQVNKYYDLVTSFYEYGWGESFHFAPRFFLFPISTWSHEIFCTKTNKTMRFHLFYKSFWRMFFFLADGKESLFERASSGMNTSLLYN